MSRKRNNKDSVEFCANCDILRKRIKNLEKELGRANKQARKSFIQLAQIERDEVKYKSHIEKNKVKYKCIKNDCGSNDITVMNLYVRGVLKKYLICNECGARKKV